MDARPLRCSTPDKRAWETKAQAEIMARQLNRTDNGDREAYRCGCGRFHHRSKERRAKMKNKGLTKRRKGKKS